MTLKKFATVDDLVAFAAQEIVAQVAHALAAHGRVNLALSGGSTPAPLYRRLAALALPWAQTHVYWADERCVPPDDDGSNYKLARETLLDHVPIPPENVHRVRGELSPEAAAQDYVKQLRESAEHGRAFPRLTAAILGMGSDGHTASLFPGSPVDITEPAVAVTADYDGRPANRVTLTPAVLNESELVLFLVTGASKAGALTAVLEGPHLPQKWPAQRIQAKHGRVLWLADQAAASQLTIND